MNNCVLAKCSSYAAVSGFPEEGNSRPTKGIVKKMEATFVTFSRYFHSKYAIRILPQISVTL